jgi:hypothetical protein
MDTSHSNDAMDESTPRPQMPAPLGSVEPHVGMLRVPPDDQLLYKMITVENLLRSIAGGYLHFNRVDSYVDFSGADPYDGKQLPRDQQGNASSKFEKAPNFSAADYYDKSRSRTYACCFSLENSNFIWRNYANGGAKGKVCVVFEFGKLRAALNRIFEPGNASLEYNGMRCHQIFSINYGIVEYVDLDRHQANAERLPNPIKYTYLKDEAFSDEKELRISLSALGIGHFALNDGTIIEFPPSLQVPLNFRTAIADGTVQRILCAPNADSNFLKNELNELCIVPK